MIVENCGLLNNWFDDDLESVKFTCLNDSFGSDLNGFTIQVFFADDLKGTIILLLTDKSRGYYPLQDGKGVQITFGSLRQEAVETNGIWNTNDNQAVIFLNAQIFGFLLNAIDDGDVFSYQIGKLGDVYRIHLPIGTMKMFESFAKQVMVAVQD